MYISNTAYMITGQNIKFLLAVLNSKFSEYSFKKFYAVSLGKNGIRWLAQCIRLFCVPPLSSSEQLRYTIIVDEILNLPKHSKDKKDKQEKLEEKLNAMVYELYNLSPGEIDHIEKSTTDN